MLRKLFGVVMVTVLVIAAFSSLALAGVSGPDSPMVPTDDYIPITEGELHWYAFNYDFDEDVDAPMEVRLYADQIEDVVLTVHDQDQIDMWVRDGEKAHFGCCTVVDQDKDNDGMMDHAIWSGLLEASGTYYILVEMAEGASGPVYYRFDVAGENFSMLGDESAAAMSMADGEVTTEAAPAAAMPEPIIMTVEEKEPTTVEGLMGSSPFFALTPSTDWVALEPGTQHWYAFDYDWDDDWTIMPEIRLETTAINDVLLTLHNGQQARDWELGEDLEHFGCCTVVDEDEDDNGVMDYAIWSGGLRSSGRYYIVVDAPEYLDENVLYRFELSGEGVQ